VSSGQALTEAAPGFISTSIPPRVHCPPIWKVLSFEGAPHFEGAMILAAPAAPKNKDDVPITPWRISAKVKADPLPHD
jgi:hypothetical protein